MATTKNKQLPIISPGAPESSRPRGMTPDGLQYNHAVRLPMINASDVGRRPSCLEIDFPIGPINTLAQLEMNSRKPVYGMGKWWARRQSSIFRALLLAAATEAPENADEADQRIWTAYYGNHQAGRSFSGIRVLDPFMGGGTTLIEGSRLGFDVVGVDLNPVAWFVTKTTLADVAPDDVQALFDDVERGVRPQVIPYTVTDCPHGHRGRWYRTDDDVCPFNVRTALELGYTLLPQPPTFDILSVPEEQRARYRYAGPEVVYTFWVKHGPCQRCEHRTPVLRSPVVAVKELTVQAVRTTCEHCKIQFDWELQTVRLAPTEPLVVGFDELPFVAPGSMATKTACPGCGGEVQRPSIERPLRKKVALTLLVHPRWMAGSAASDAEGDFGGWAGAPVAAEKRWLEARARDLILVEVRGKVPPTIQDPLDSNNVIVTERGTAQYVARTNREGVLEEKPVDSSFVCGACGYAQDFLTAVKPTGRTPPAYPYVLQGYCPECDTKKIPYGGRFFKTPDAHDRDRWLAAVAAWAACMDTELGNLVPSERLPFAHMTHDLNGGIPNWGYTHWWKMFNPRQLLTHTRLLQGILAVPGPYNQATREEALIAFQQYLRNHNMFAFWNLGADKMEPFFATNNYHPKATVIENGCFAELGRGNWYSCSAAVVDGLQWARQPWEKAKPLASTNSGSIAIDIDDPIQPSNVKGLYSASSTDLSFLQERWFDLIITDPPFGGNVFYADLADFFYAWLRKPLSRWYPDYFQAPETNKVQEAITNPAEHPDYRTSEEKRAAKKAGLETPADEFYREALTACWSECSRVLKDGGTMAFTFHHSEDQAWIGVLRSLFDAGFVLVATYPIRSDESKGDNAAFGSKKIEYDIIHVCRKQLETPQRVSWASMRRWVKEEIERLHSLLQHYQRRQLSEADIRVILTGKALEYYSRHYGAIFTGEDEPLEIAEALIGINAILEEEHMAAVDRPPDPAEPLTRLYLRVFKDRTEVPRDELSKMLRGTGATAEDLEERGWAEEENKVWRIVPIQIRFDRLRKRRRDEMKYDLDQAHFLIGAGVPGSKVQISVELGKETFRLKPAVPSILQWIALRETDATLREAAGRALRLVEAWLAEQRSGGRAEQTSFFDE